MKSTAGRMTVSQPLNCTSLALLAMALLVFQGTALSLTLRYSRTTPGPPFLASVAVIYTEAIKLLLCVGAQMFVCRRNSKEHTQGWRQEFPAQAAEILSNSAPMALPAALFVMQQVLVIIAASHLDAVTFQICSQSFKIMPTAVFAAWLLGQRLTGMQWASLPVLASGVVFVTLNTSGGPAASSGSGSGAGSSGSEQDATNLLLGLGACAVAGVSSAYAGVYFEKYVKGAQSRSLTVRNLQLSLYGLPFSLLYMYLKDGGARHADGFMIGFDALAWAVVGLQVFGGLIVAMVVKHADNILKNFANALAVIFTVLGSIPIFGQYPSYWFLLGALLVSLSVALYGTTPEQSAQYCDAIGVFFKEPVWMHTFRTQPSVQLRRARCLECAGHVMSYAAALTLALGCTATLWLVIAAKTQALPLYSPDGGLQLVAVGELDELSARTMNASLGNTTWDGGGRLRN